MFFFVYDHTSISSSETAKELSSHTQTPSSEEDEDTLTYDDIWRVCETTHATTPINDMPTGRERIRMSLLPDPGATIVSPEDLEIGEDGKMLFKDENVYAFTQIRIDGDLDISHVSVSMIPQNLYVNGNLSISTNDEYFVLPKKLVVNGNFSLDGNIQKLPAVLVIKENFATRYTKIQNLPETLLIGKNLDIHAAPIIKLPTLFFVGADINLAQTSIQSLPENLSVHGDLNLTETPLTQLPCGLNVKNTLIIAGTKIQTLPKDLQVRNILNIRNSLLSTKIQENPNIITDTVDYQVYY